MQVVVVNKDVKQRMCYSTCHMCECVCVCVCVCVFNCTCVCIAAFLGFRFAVLLQHSIKGDRTPRRQICIQNKAARRLGHWDTNLPLQPLPHTLATYTHVHAQAQALGVRVCAPVRG